ncbi:MAG: hypothetical protein WKF85_13880 [Chitinophagaceae bacterium]
MFLTEKDLVASLKKNVGQICEWGPEHSYTAILEEVNLGYGIADLVISKITDNNLHHQRLTYFDITIYKIVEVETDVTFEKIKLITKASKSSILKSIKKLMMESFVNESDTFFKVTNQYKMLSEETIAIEAKLKNWKRALEQAFRYKWFSDQSYVVLDSKSIKPAIKNLNEFKKFEVGLAEINILGHVNILYKAPSMKPIDERMLMLLNEHIKDYLVSK